MKEDYRGRVLQRRQLISLSICWACEVVCDGIFINESTIKILNLPERVARALNAQLFGARRDKSFFLYCFITDTLQKKNVYIKNK